MFYHLLRMLTNPFILSAVIILAMMTIVYMLALVKDDYSIIDIFWPVGFLLQAIVLLDWSGHLAEILMKIFVTLWSVRLCSYLFYRIMKHGPDKRYKELQLEWGVNHRLHAFFKVFMLQGAFMYLISMPIILATYVTGTNMIFLILGALVWKIGFVLEALADFQLYSFRQNPENKGKYLMTGLFKYSRHPNYLGEILVWMGISLLTLPNTYGLLPLLGPAVITFALYKFSGVPYAERNRRGSKGFQEYCESTGAIFPKLF